MGAKANAAAEALKFIKAGQVVGLGSGSTAAIFIELLAEKAKAESLGIRCIPTSNLSKLLAYNAGLPLIEGAEAAEIDVAVDGADLVDPKLNLIKGGGGAHAREKVIDYSAKKFIAIVDDSKISKKLRGNVPLEVLPFALPFVQRHLKNEFGVRAELRRKPSGDVVMSDNGNFIADAHFRQIPNPAKLEVQLDAVPGLVANGIFSRNVSAVIVGYEKKSKVLKKKA